MPFCLCKSRKSGGEHEGKHEDYANSVRTSGDGALHGESVKKPDRNHKKRQDYAGDDHRYTSGYAIAVVVVNAVIVRFLPGFLLAYYY